MVTLNKGLRDLLLSDMELTVKEMSDNSEFSRSNTIIEKSLYKLLMPTYPKVEVYTFGSREIGVATDDSDLDIYIDTDNSYYTHSFDKDIYKRLGHVQQLLLRSNQWRDIHVIDAKVPLVQAFHKEQGVNCDISFSDGMGHCNTDLVKFFCEVQPIMRGMIMFLKIWLHRAGLSNCIKNYTLTLLIINFLQHKRYLPSVKAVQKGIIQPDKIGPWIVHFDKTIINHLDLERSDDLEDLILEFFKFFSDSSKFDYVISTYLGVLVPKKYFTESGSGVKSFKNYYTFINKYPHEAYTFSPMKVQGPFNLAENPAKQVSSKNLQTFVSLSGASFTLLNSK